MLLSDRDLWAALESGALRIVPKLGPGAASGRPSEAQIQPNSIDLLLGDSFQRPRRDRGSATNLLPLRLRESNAARMTRLTGLPIGGEIIVQPGEFLLGVTDEWIELDAAHTAVLEGKSSSGRAGLQFHCAGRVDAGFRGRLTLEIVNFAPWPVMLEVGQPVVQLAVERLSSAALRPYGDPALGSRYQGQVDAEPSRGSLRGYLGMTGTASSLAQANPAQASPSERA